MGVGGGVADEGVFLVVFAVDADFVEEEPGGLVVHEVPGGCAADVAGEQADVAGGWRGGGRRRLQGVAEDLRAFFPAVDGLHVLPAVEAGPAQTVGADLHGEFAGEEDAHGVMAQAAEGHHVDGGGFSQIQTQINVGALETQPTLFGQEGLAEVAVGQHAGIAAGIEYGTGVAQDGADALGGIGDAPRLAVFVEFLELGQDLLGVGAEAADVSPVVVFAGHKRPDVHRHAAATRHERGQDVAALEPVTVVRELVGLPLPRRARQIGPDLGDVGFAGLEEIGADGHMARLLIGDGADPPVLAFAARHDGIVTDDRIQAARLVPIDRHLPEKLKFAHTAVVFDEVGGHLERAVKHDIVGELAGAGGGHVVAVLPRFVGGLEDAGRVVERPRQHARVRQDGRVAGRIAFAPGVPFHAAHAFAGHEVGPGAAQAGVLDRLVGVDHDLVFRGDLDDPLVMADHPLAVVKLPGRTDLARVTGLDAVDAEAGVQRKCAVEHAVVGRHIAAGLVVADQGHAMRPRRVRQCLQVKVAVRRDVVPGAFLPPAFPAGVPALDEHAGDAVTVRKTDVAQRLVGRRAVARALGPGVAAIVHAPPDADVLHRLDPGDIGDLGRRIEVEQEG